MSEYAPFLDSRLYISRDESVGYGVFAKESIKSHAFIEIAPVVDFSPESRPDENLMKHVVEWEGRLAVALGWTMVYNHSDANNCAFSMNYFDKLIAIISIRDIEAGEQLTVNYGPNWFSSRGMHKVTL
jgi:SET domain-containing protein